jgi:hypothetical protein
VDDFLDKQTVLLVKTGDQSDLSAPISFESLEPVPMYFPENSTAEDFLDKYLTRVSLGTGVKFIAGLEKREEDALLASKPAVMANASSEDRE